LKLLLTSARLPHALGEIRKLGQAGHEIYATDTFRTAPGLHSREVHEAILTSAPAFETDAFIAEISEILSSRRIDMLLPCFEELFYLAKHVDQLEGSADLFFSPFETLSRLHNKESFTELTRSLGVPIAKTVIAHSDAELVKAVGTFPEYFARAAFSRGGISLLTNTGPLAGAVAIAECHPTPENPWLVQEFVIGEDLCSMSIAHHGKLAAHCTYRHPLTIEHAGGIVFESIDCPEALEISRTYIEALDLHGQISFDTMQTAAGLTMIECNPRPTAAVFLMEPGELSKAIFDPDFDAPTIVPAGRREQIGIAILRDMFREPKNLPSDLRRLLDGTEDVYSQKGDRLPGLYQILSFTHILAYRHRLQTRKHSHSALMEAQFYDIAWDG
jgi:predicted ATP-grasp superfamily ATP-dependent carboligase